MKKHLLMTAMMSGLFLTAMPAFSDSPVKHGQTASQAGQKIDKSTAKNTTVDKVLAEKIKRMAKDTSAALKGIEDARSALKAEDGAKATELLQTALGKLEAVMAIDPNLKLLPISEENITIDAFHTAEAAYDARREVQRLLRKGRVQDARLLMKDMASEIDIRTTNIPLATYAEAIRVALPLVTAQNYAGADDVLAVAQKTFVIRDQIIPLPLVRMVTALEAAQALEAKNADKGLSETDKQTVFDLLDYADEQMQLTVALGYADKGSYKQTRKLLQTMRKNITKHASNTEAYKKAIGDVKATNDKLESAQDRADKKAESKK